MGRRAKHKAHENHERWLVSYADFITLLFAFFVVMFATSQSDKGKAEQISNAVRDAIDNGHLPSALAAVLGGTVHGKGQGNAQLKGPGGAQALAVKTSAAVVADLVPSMERLSRELETEIKDGKLQVELQPRGLVVSLREAAFFPSGEDRILPQSLGMLSKVAEVTRSLPNPIRLEGHTDSVPIYTERFRSNWELSTARSIAILELFNSRFGVPYIRMAVAGYAETLPVASNLFEEGRARNRRVEIVILSMQGLKTEPGGAARQPETPAPPSSSAKATAQAAGARPIGPA
jgi:chemotaxis protein MotB